MRHVIVNRVTAALFTVFLLCAGLFAWMAPPRTDAAREEERTPQSAPSVTDGETLFARHCASCHTPEDVASTLGIGAERAQRMGEFETFLQDHGEATPHEDRLILEYLAGAR